VKIKRQRKNLLLNDNNLSDNGMLSGNLLSENLLSDNMVVKITCYHVLSCGGVVEGMEWAQRSIS
jgi:hypothetical protein